MRRTTTAKALVASLAVLLVGTGCAASTEHAAAPTVDVVEAGLARPSAQPGGPSAAPFDLSALPRPALDSIIAAPRTDATLADVHAVGRALFGTEGVAAVARPTAQLTPAYAAATDTAPPVLALERTTLEQPAAWLVTELKGDWVRVLVPLGRGALPGADPDAVNGRAVWVSAAAVDLTSTRASVVVDLSDRVATITDADGNAARVSVGIGKAATATPRGLGSLAGFARNPDGLDVAVTSMQSTSLDGYDGADFAAVALHPDPEDGAALGRDRSNGCIRMDAADYREHVDRVLPLGSPVWVIA